MTKRLAIALAMCLVAVTAARCGEVSTIKYVYTIEVVTYGPKEKSEQAAAVDVKWPGGAKTLTLAGRRAFGTVEMAQAIPQRQRGGGGRAIDFMIDVAASKPGYDTWKAKYTPGDFVPGPDGAHYRVDKIILQATDATLTPQQREQLSQALPCGLDLYTEQFFGDFNGDGNPDAALSVRKSDLGQRSGLPDQPPYAEIRHLSLVGGQWKCLFLANHQGVFVDGKQVAGTGPAPCGYSFGMRGHAGGSGAAEGWMYRDLVAVDEEGKAAAGAPVLTYLWPAGAASFQVLAFDLKDVPGLLGLLKSPIEEVRMRAALTLGQVKDNRAVAAALVAALAEENPYVRAEVLAALVRLAGKDLGKDRAAWEAWLKEFPPPGRPEKP
jgi:hypothetical protein